MRRPAIVLVRPSEEGNVGAAARAMANLGLAELVLVEPAAPIGDVARAFAVGAAGLLDGARRAPSLAAALAPYARIVGTTSARDRQLPQSAIAPRELPAALAADPPETATAILFGPERSGLGNDELAHCSLLVRAPCALEHPTLNLAQAVLLVAYELRLADAGLGGEARRAAPEPLATHDELEGLFAQGRELLETSGFAHDSSFAGVLVDLRRLLARAQPTAREVSILRGVCRRLARATR